MAKDLMLDVDQAGELKAAFRRWNWTNADVKRFCKSDRGPDFLKVLDGYAEVTIVRHIINMDADPYCPSGLTVEKNGHMKGGQLELDPQNFRLYLSEKQKAAPWIRGHDLRKEVQPLSPYNANLLDYWLAHPALIPEECKGKATFFWGTIYRDSGGYLYVRYLYWDGTTPLSYYHCLGGDFHSSGPAAVPASIKKLSS